MTIQEIRQFPYDPWVLLGVPKEASDADVHRAWKHAGSPKKDRFSSQKQCWPMPLLGSKHNSFSLEPLSLPRKQPAPSPFNPVIAVQGHGMKKFTGVISTKKDQPL